MTIIKINMKLMRMSITINGVTRNYNYEPLQDYNLLLQDFVDDVATYEEEKNKDYANENLVNV